MSSSTPRLTTPSLPAMMLLRRAPTLVTCAWSKPLYILPSRKMWQSASRCVFATPCGAIEK